MRVSRYSGVVPSGTRFPGKVFPGGFWKGYDAFFEYGVGAMAWGQEKDADGVTRRVFYFLAPYVGEPTDHPFGRFECARIYTMTDGQDWCNPGPVNGWDGNEERPTFNPSIWLRDREGWHGFIQNGVLVTA